MNSEPNTSSDHEDEKAVGRVGLTLATLISIYAVGVAIGLLILFLVIL